MEDQSTDVPARAALRRWVGADQRRSQAALARTIGVTQPSVSAWLAGPSRPESHHREALELLTGIPADDWKTESERAVVQRAKAIADTDLAATGS